MSIQPITPFQTNVKNINNTKNAAPSFQMSQIGKLGDEVADKMKPSNFKVFAETVIGGIKKIVSFIFDNLKKAAEWVMGLFKSEPVEPITDPSRLLLAKNPININQEKAYAGIVETYRNGLPKVPTNM